MRFNVCCASRFVMIFYGQRLSSHRTYAVRIFRARAASISNHLISLVFNCDPARRRGSRVGGRALALCGGTAPRKPVRAGSATALDGRIWRLASGFAPCCAAPPDNVWGSAGRAFPLPEVKNPDGATALTEGTVLAVHGAPKNGEQRVAVRRADPAQECGKMLVAGVAGDAHRARRIA